MSKTSYSIPACQSCNSKLEYGKLDVVLDLGFLPPVNQFRPVEKPPTEETFYPAQLLRCSECTLVQLGCVVDQEVLFPASYPYTSSTTAVLRKNFAELADEVFAMWPELKSPNNLIVDIGSNDGNLLSNFKGRMSVLGVTPEDIGKIAVERGIPTMQAYFDADAAAAIVLERGRASVVTATNVFAHIDDPNELVENVLGIMHDDGVFISESHYLGSLLETVQYDTVYHEHLRYYSIGSLQNLLARHGLEIFKAKKISPHGGSIRVYAARVGMKKRTPSVDELLKEEEKSVSLKALKDFKQRVTTSKADLNELLAMVNSEGASVYGVGAPSRATTLINYVGIDQETMPVVVEVAGSKKIGMYVPGTRIPIVPESYLVSQRPEYALLLSWHIADELMPKLRAAGFEGKFIVPLPEPRIVG